MTKSNLFYVLLMIGMVQFACNNDDDLNLNTNIEFSNCLKEETVSVPIFSSDWCTQDSTSTTEFCETIEIETPFRLSEDERAWLPYYCLGVGKPVYYHNESGDEISIVITDKSFSELKTGFYQPFCSSDSTLQTKYCITNEVARVSFVSEILDIEMTINLSPLVKIIDADNVEVGTYIQISSFRQSPFEYTTHFSAVVDSGNLSSPNVSGGVNFYPEITVLNQTFANVHSYESFFSEHILILYNQEYGIVSFIDESGEKWVINQ